MGESAMDGVTGHGWDDGEGRPGGSEQKKVEIELMEGAVGWPAGLRSSEISFLQPLDAALSVLGPLARHPGGPSSPWGSGAGSPSGADCQGCVQRELIAASWRARAGPALPAATFPTPSRPRQPTSCPPD